MSGKIPLLQRTCQPHCWEHTRQKASSCREPPRLAHTHFHGSPMQHQLTDVVCKSLPTQGNMKGRLTSRAPSSLPEVWFGLHHSLILPSICPVLFFPLPFTGVDPWALPINILHRSLRLKAGFPESATCTAARN